MFEITIHTLKEKRNGIIAFSLFILVFGILMIAAYDSIALNINLDELIEQYPDYIKDFFGKSIVDFGEFGGFYTLEYMTWVWFLIIPAYLAMVCSGLIAGEVENKTADILMSYPLSRWRIFLEKYASMVDTVLLINLMGVLSTYIGITAYNIDFSMKWIVVAMVQATPFLLAWSAAFTLLSVIISDAKKASTYSIALVFLMYFVEVLSGIWEKLALLGRFSPMHYFDPGLVLSRKEITWNGTVLLLVLACVLVIVAGYIFNEKDIL